MKLKDVLNIEIGGATFEIIKNDYFESSLKRVKNNSGIELRHCYSNYSRAKENVYDEWLKWTVDSNAGKYFGVASYNCMMFTLTTILDCNNCNIDNYIYITPSHNFFVVNGEKWNELKTLCNVLKKEFKETLKQYVNVAHEVLCNYNCYMIAKEEALFLLNNLNYDEKFKLALGGIDNDIAMNVINAVWHDLNI